MPSNTIETSEVFTAESASPQCSVIAEATVRLVIRKPAYSLLKVSDLADDPSPTRIIPIQDLGSDTIEVVKPIYATVQFEDGAFVASFFDANVNASGENEREAVEMLKEMIASNFIFFQENEAILWDVPQQQLAVLRKFLRAK